MRFDLVSASPDSHNIVALQAADAPGGGRVRVTVDLGAPRQTLLGIGGALTQASAHALAGLSPARRAEVIDAFFGADGADFTLCRTHIASCDFSTYSYTYAPDADAALADFSIDHDRSNGLLALIKDAQGASGAGFRLMASPWTAPPWMKDNGQFFDSGTRRGGTLRDEHLQTFADYLLKYIDAYAAEGIPIWSLSPLNEPHGNSGSWESMEMSPEQQRDLVVHIGDTLRAGGHDTQILIYDQNRPGMRPFAEPILRDPAAARHVLGTAIHWYDSTFRVFEDEINALHDDFPDKLIVQTEGCIDNVFQKGQPKGPGAPTPWWNDDGWYWRKVATDWGWDWLDNPEVDHPPYAAAFRYARDIVGCLANHVAGWIDWNIVLDRHGGPNHVGNFCLAPVLVDPEHDAVYYTPMFDILKQVSRSSRPGATVHRVDHDPTDGLWVTALCNPDGRWAVHLFNESPHDRPCHLAVGDHAATFTVPRASLLTITLGG